MKILIFKVNQLGDNVVFLPVIQTLRHLQPDWQLRVVTSPTAAGLYAGCLPPEDVLTIPTPDFNRLWKSPGRLWSWLRRLRAWRPDAVLLAEDQGNVAHLLGKLSGARHRVGPRVAFVRVPQSLTCSVPAPAAGPGLLARWAWDCLQALWQELRLPTNRIPATPPCPELADLCAKQEASSANQPILIHPGASLPHKRWPQENFTALANRLSQEHPVHWIAHGASAPPTLAPKVIVRTPTDLPAVLTELHQAALFIGNHSGPFHLANALGTPSLILSGPTRIDWDPIWHVEKTQILRAPGLSCLPCDSPDRPSLHCTNLNNPMACMEAWSVDHVVSLARQTLAAPSPSA